MAKYDTLPVAIDKVLKDQTIDDKTKLERIETYIEVYFDNNKPSLAGYDLSTHFEQITSKKKKMPFINKTPSHVFFATELHILNLLK
jgi:hypothetical protein